MNLNPSPEPIQATIRKLADPLCLPLDLPGVDIRELTTRARMNAKSPEIGMSDDVPILRRFIYELTAQLREQVLSAMRMTKEDESFHSARLSLTGSMLRSIREPENNFTNDKSHLDPRNWDFREAHQFACSITTEIDWRLVMLGVLAAQIDAHDQG